MVVVAIGGAVALTAAHRPETPAPPAAAPGSAGPDDPDWSSIETLRNLVELPADYPAATGWRYNDQAVTWKCNDLGLTEPAPFCTS